MKKTEMTSYQKFIILTMPRSGSNYLSYLLHSHPQIMSLGEVYCPETIWGQPGKEGLNHNKFFKIFRDVFPIWFLKSVIFRHYPHQIQAVGFRFFYHHADHYPKVLQALLKMKDLKIIHLQRENLLENLISLRLASKTNVWSSLNEPRRELTKITLSFKECVDYFEKTTATRNKFAAKFSNLPTLDVYYENLLKSSQEAKKILKFLNVSERILTCSLKKQNLFPPRQVVKNYGELKKKFSNTKWQHFFT